jgi:hypothetical protein
VAGLAVKPAGAAGGLTQAQLDSVRLRLV